MRASTPKPCKKVRSFGAFFSRAKALEHCTYCAGKCKWYRDAMKEDYSKRKGA